MTMRFVFLPAAFVAALFVSATPVITQSAQTRRPIGLDDLANVRAVSDPQVSADGQWMTEITS